MPNTKNIIDIKLEGIGPFENKIRLDFNSGDTNKAIRLGIYAANGSGKTFISRCFNEFVTATTGGEQYYPKNNLINLGKPDGKFEFDVQIKDGMSSKFKMPIDRANSPITPSGASDVIFHVFNSDYVKKQFMVKDWIPDGNISGEITIGEENVKVTTLTEEIAIKTADNEVIEKNLEAAIKLAKDGVRENYDVRTNLNAYQGITLENIIKGNLITIAKTKSVLVGEYDSVKEFAKVSDNVADVPTLSIISTTIDVSEIDRELSEPYTKKTIQSRFLEKIKSNTEFIRQGLRITKNDGKCPYCEQTLDGAQDIIQAYNDFFDATQEEVSKKLAGYKKQFESLEAMLAVLVSGSTKSVKLFNGLKDYFPSTKEVVANPIVLPDGLVDAIKLCKDTIQSKMTDISQAALSISNSFADVHRHIETINTQTTALNIDIKKVNTAKSGLTGELKNIKDGLCKATFNEIIAVNRADIDRFNLNGNRLKAVREELRLLQAKTPRKDLVYTEFCRLIKMYFGDKYSVEADTFKMKLNAQDIEPAFVLSDGEKSIIAFCYYLANTHTKISDKSDYNKVLFVIDDPISSMDFNFVFETAQIIKNLDKIIDGKKPKFIILTHNAEFMNILYGNRLLSRGYHLKKGMSGTIPHLKDGLVAPYQNHLEDVLSIAEGTVLPCHTTYNSMRHILECIKGFVSPNIKELDDFIETQVLNGKKLFEENGHIIRVIQDMSHGKPREVADIDDAKTIDGCKELIAYINDRFPGQVPHIQR